MSKYYLYARKSIDEEDRQVLSIESQLAEVREFAKKEKLNIVKEFIEIKTAKEPGRPVFNHMIELIEDGEADGILAWHPDRLARNSVDGGRIIYLIDTGKIKSLKFPTSKFDNTAQGKFILSITLSQSKYYVDNLSENVKRGFRQKLRRGEWPGWAPLGYLNDPKTHNVILDPDKYLLIKKAFELYAEGNQSLYELAKEVSRWGLTSRTGKKVQTSIINHMLRNPFYYGVIRFRRELYEGTHQPIISKQLFDKVQSVMKLRTKPSKKRKEKFNFLGFIKCGECGCMITAEQQKWHNYYRCTKKRGKCSQRYLREENLAEQMKEKIKEVWLNDEICKFMLDKLEKDSKQEQEENQNLIEKLQAQLKKLNDKLERLLDVHISGLIEQEEYQAKKQKLLNQKLEIKERSGNLQGKADSWLEPCKDFITRCNYVKKIALEGNLPRLRRWLEIGGSNFFLKDRILSFSWQRPFSFVAEGNRNINSFTTFSRREIEKDPPASPQKNSPRQIPTLCVGSNSADLNFAIYTNWLPGLDSNQHPSGYE